MTCDFARPEDPEIHPVAPRGHSCGPEVVSFTQAAKLVLERLRRVRPEQAEDEAEHRSADLKRDSLALLQPDEPSPFEQVGGEVGGLLWAHADPADRSAEVENDLPVL